MTSVLWRSEAHADLPVLVRESRPGETCGIFHLDIPDVDVDGVGPVWLEDKPYNAAELPCGHVFHACALAVHSLANDMRCPVCRAGPPDRAQVSGFAAAMQPALLAKKLALDAARREDEAGQIDVDVDLDVDAITRGLVFEIYMQSIPTARGGRASRRAPRDMFARLETPLQLVASSDAPRTDHLDYYSTHRSFQRKFNLHFRFMQPEGNVIYLGLSHPLMFDVVRSTLLDKAALLACAENGTRIALSGNIGFVLPRRTDFGIELMLQLNTSYISMACIQNLVDISGLQRT